MPLRVHVRNADPETRLLVREAARYALDELCGRRLADNLTVHVEFVHQLKKREKRTADCVWRSRKRHPRDFDVRIDDDLSTRRKTFVCLMHELVHVKQFARNELYDFDDGATRWQSRRIENGSITYYNYPWEKEAYALQGPLYRSWLRSYPIDARPSSK